MPYFLQKFGIFCLLDNNQYDFNKSYEYVVGAGAIRSVIANENNKLTAIDSFIQEADDWIFGHVAYDIKNEIESLHSLHPDGIQFPDFLFFVPEIVFIIDGNKLQIGVINNFNADEIFEEIISYKIPVKEMQLSPEFETRFSENEYNETVNKILDHIRRGDCYEMNFCQEFFANDIEIDPIRVYQKLSELSPNPFAAFYKHLNKYLICASPERFLKKTANTIISQPIKGTARRILDDAKADGKQKEKLLNNLKERSENIMIVDLVRNDLAKVCEEGSVKVDEFLSIYSFPQVHQMISTISGVLKKNKSFSEIFNAAFPMGSMTGAPKKRVLELIEKYERTKRGLFSGTLGYISPSGDFDFNVIIRSILYNQDNKYISIQAGSAITFKSKPKKEFEECLVKIEVLMKALKD